MYKNLDKDRPETDNIIYYLGRRTETLLNKRYEGPTPEIYNSKYEPEIRLVLRNKDKLNLEKMKFKEIENIVYPAIPNLPKKEIWQTKYNKHLEINYKTVYDLLLVLQGYRCPLCNNDEDSIEHMYLKCKATEKIRIEIEGLISICKETMYKMNLDDIKYLTIINEKVAYAIISIYKIGIWEARKISKFKNKPFSHNNTLNIINRQIKISLNYLTS